MRPYSVCSMNTTTNGTHHSFVADCVVLSDHIPSYFHAKNAASGNVMTYLCLSYPWLLYLSSNATLPFKVPLPYSPIGYLTNYAQPDALLCHVVMDIGTTST